MRKVLAAALLAALLLPAAAQQKPAADQEEAADAPKAFLLDVSEARAKRGRVPNGYGQLGLTRDQKERIYGIQAAYDERIKALEAEIEQLEEEETVQIKNVLNDGQRVQIEKYEEQRAARRRGD